MGEVLFNALSLMSFGAFYITIDDYWGFIYSPDLALHTFNIQNQDEQFE